MHTDWKSEINLIKNFDFYFSIFKIKKILLLQENNVKLIFFASYIAMVRSRAMVENIEETKAITDISTTLKNYPELVDLPILNVDTFQSLRQSIDDDLIFSDLVTIYLNSAENLLEEIQLAFVNQDPSQFSLSAHSLKSTSASIGAVRLSQLCKYLEQVGKTGKLSISSDVLDLLTNEYEQVIKAIKVSVIEFMSE